MEKKDKEVKEHAEKTEKTKEEVQEERKKRKAEEAAKKAEKKAKEKEKKPEVKEQKEVKEKIHKVVKIYESNAKLVRPEKGKPIHVKKDDKNILITSALPYVNNEPHLGNIIGCVLSADVFARFSRLAGYNTIYVCGTDEYGTATETKAIQEGVSPKELCDKYYELHKNIYEWFDIDFDIFGRTPTPQHTTITQDIFLKLQKNNNILKKLVKQFKCFKCNMFLADRFVFGTCHHSGCLYPDAGGDQCDKCGKLITATELIDPKCKMCNDTPQLCDSYHYFIDLPKIEPELKEWINEAHKEWSNNSSKQALGFLAEGLVPRCITRDLKWGISVPSSGDSDLDNKVFYVWFDAPIGYLSITANLVGEEWENWWKNPDNVSLYQFMGKDNVTFHSIIFPSSLIGTGEKYTKVKHLSTTEYLTYEGDKFSKRNGTGVFGSHAMESGIPSEVWRYYLLSNRPETGDADFFWDKFAEKTNSELLANPGNLCQRVFSFINSKFESKVPGVSEKGLFNEDIELISNIHQLFETYVNSLEKLRIREGIEIVMKISTEANAYLTKQEPWNVFKKDPERCATIISILVATIRLVACVAEPYIPGFSAKVYEILGIEYNEFNSKLIYHLKNDFKELYVKLSPIGNTIKEANPIFAGSK